VGGGGGGAGGAAQGLDRGAAGGGAVRPAGPAVHRVQVCLCGWLCGCVALCLFVYMYAVSA
jgi:hypothetical protein